MVVEYDSTGNVVRQSFARNLFPPHQDTIQQNPQIGAIAAGYDSGNFWFWLPKSSDLVTIRTDDGTIASRIQAGIHN